MLSFGLGREIVAARPKDVRRRPKDSPANKYFLDSSARGRHADAR
jgi:hypothetical protein